MTTYAGPGTILAADDEPANLDVLRRLMTRHGYQFLPVRDGEQALESVRRDRPDIVLLDLEMPKINGFEVCRRLKADPQTRLIPVVIITGLSAAEDRLRGIDAGADDFLTKPFNVPELLARVRSLVRLKRYTDELDSAESVILSLGLTVEARDPYTRGHCARLAHYATALGERLALGEEQLVALHRGAYLHDVGKVGIADAVLLKPGRYTPEEHRLMQQHTIIGYTLCGEMRSLADVRLIVRHHHERRDGTGYPDGLRGEAIPFLARILSVVDVYDALTSERPYRAPLRLADALRELRSEAGRGWLFPSIVDEFALLTESPAFDRAALTAATDSASLYPRRNVWM